MLSSSHTMPYNCLYITIRKGKWTWFMWCKPTMRGDVLCKAAFFCKSVRKYFRLRIIQPFMVLLAPSGTLFCWNKKQKLLYTCICCLVGKSALQYNFFSPIYHLSSFFTRGLIWSDNVQKSIQPLKYKWKYKLWTFVCCFL